jgi:FG-GAP-like repeat
MGTHLALGHRFALNINDLPANGPVADWDGDGRLDLIVGAEDGSVVWYRNVGSAQEPKLEAARTLVGKSPIGWGGDEGRRANDWGLRVKPCVIDWNGDGRLDILLGDLWQNTDATLPLSAAGVVLFPLSSW